MLRRASVTSAAAYPSPDRRSAAARSPARTPCVRVLSAHHVRRFATAPSAAASLRALRILDGKPGIHPIHRGAEIDLAIQTTCLQQQVANERCSRMRWAGVRHDSNHKKSRASTRQTLSTFHPTQVYLSVHQLAHSPARRTPFLHTPAACATAKPVEERQTTGNELQRTMRMTTDTR